MDIYVENRKRIVRRIAETDAEYKACYAEFMEAERDFFALLLELTEQQQERLWKFVNLSNETDERLLEIACEYLAI